MALEGKASKERVIRKLVNFGDKNRTAEKLANTAVLAPLQATLYGAVKTLKEMRPWPNMDQNYAMFMWLLDYNESRRERPVDADLERFLLQHAAFLKEFNGVAPPTRAAQAAQFEQATIRYLKAYAVFLFYYYGRLEEVGGVEAYPRYRIGDGR